MSRTRAAVGVIRLGDGLLLVPRTGGQTTTYETPGGHIEPGETPEQAVVREIREEANISAHIVRKICIFTNNNSESHYFECAVNQGEVVDPAVSKIVPITELPKTEITSFARENLEKLGYYCG